MAVARGRLIYRAVLAAVVVATLLAIGCVFQPRVALDSGANLASGNVKLDFANAEGDPSATTEQSVTNALAELGKDNLLGRYLAMMSGQTSLPWVAGNRVDLLVDGPETYESMFKAIDAARHHVHIESYIFDEARFGDQKLSDLLLRKQSEGVAVRILYDWVGTSGPAQEMIQRLQTLGIEACAFHPLDEKLFVRPDRLNHRDHRKITVVDGAVAFAGGINFSSVYSSGSSSGSAARRQRKIARNVDDGWRDTHLRIEGPAVASLQNLYIDTWDSQDCAALTGSELRPPMERAGGTLIRALPGAPGDEINLPYASVRAAVVSAQRSIDVTMAYFVPDDELEDGLIEAAARGVRVRLILPGFSDFAGVFYAGRAHYERLLEGGVELHELTASLLHAKTVVVDGIWSTVGSTNWDWRSFTQNNELSIEIVDEGFAQRMQQLFETDLRNAERISLAQWRDRPLTDRALEAFWSLSERLL